MIELAAREKLVKNGNIFSKKQLQTKAQLFVQASQQSIALDHILPVLTETEIKIYKRGKNAKCHAPKSASATEYRRATGMECLFGYLYFSGEQERIKELFDLAFGDVEI